MTTHKGFALVTTLIVLAGLLIVGGGAYLVTHPDLLQAPVAEENTQVETEVKAEATTVIRWRLTDAGERDHIPYTNVTVTINGEPYHMGEFQGSCSEIGAGGGVDGHGLLAGELSAVQCWFAGGGDEIGVFAHEDGGYQIMVGLLEEPIEGGAGYRGDFEIRTDISL